MDEMIPLELPRQGNLLFLPRPWLQVCADTVVERSRQRYRTGEQRDCRFAHRSETGDLFVKGAIEYPEHASIDLAYWYRVIPRYELPV